MEERILTVKDINFSGKWMEFWFEETGTTPALLSFDLCSKTGYVWDAVEKAGIEKDVCLNGLKGRKIKWVLKGQNWEIDSIIVKE